MRAFLRGSLAAALIAVLLVPLATANAEKGNSRSDGEKRFSALIFSKTAAFRHTECIPQGTVAIAQMAATRGFEVDATENAALFTDENLAKYDVVIFLCTTGDVLNAGQQAAFERYIQAGGGYAGIHSASDTEYDWPWYGGLVGAYFRDHPGVAGVNQQFQTATMNVEDRHTPATRQARQDVDARGGMVQLPYQSARRRARPAVGRRVDLRPARLQRPGRLAADGRPPDLVVPRVRRRAVVLHGARAQGRLLGGAAAARRTSSAASRWPRGRSSSTATDRPAAGRPEW